MCDLGKEGAELGETGTVGWGGEKGGETKWGHMNGCGRRNPLQRLFLKMLRNLGVPIEHSGRGHCAGANNNQEGEGAPRRGEPCWVVLKWPHV